MLTLPLDSPLVSFENSGGKGSNLGRLARLNLFVPTGFILTTAAYRLFVQSNGLQAMIAASLAGLEQGNMEALEAASQKIRSAFSRGDVPEEIDQALLQSYHHLGGPPFPAVAVRSSATTEDLPDLSFAGQQETYLNVIGENQLRKAVVNCWSSLWTARAIGYRQRNAILEMQPALAVVVQVMVPSETSGVLFTANPLTGALSECLIDATFGLGEALVSGQVEPDHFVVDSVSGEIKETTLGKKEISISGLSGGGVEAVRQESPTRQSLTRGQLLHLVGVGEMIQKEYGAPQDIEFAYVGNELHILQARPITSLFPVPRISFDPLLAWFSFGAFQGIMGPLTPLGQESIQRVVLGVGKKLLGLDLTFEAQQTVEVAGERLWIRVSDLLRNPLGKRILSGFLGIGEPGTAQTLRQLSQDPRLGGSRGRIRVRTVFRLLRFLSSMLHDMPRVMLRPEEARDRFDARIEVYLQTVHIPPGADRFERLAKFVSFMKGQGGLAEALPVVLPRFAPFMATSLASLNLIGRLISISQKEPEKSGSMMDALDVTRGLPRNVTTEMDLGLWNTARIIQQDPSGLEAFTHLPAAELASRYMDGTFSAPSQIAIHNFLSLYGVRGVGEIDLGQPRWQEDPTPVIATLQSYLQIPPEAAPDRLFEANARSAEVSIERMADAVRSGRAGWIKEKILRAAARRVRLLLGTRESPKFYAVRAMSIVRKTLLGIGEEYAAAGTIQQREDLFFLHVDELEALARAEPRDFPALIAMRREAYERESRRRLIPRILLSDGRAYYEGVDAPSKSGETIIGSPVSAGVVEGIVRVVRDPRTAGLKPGEILVCQGTDPAWTPLFMVAGGLIMEVGGMMTHGSVIAREYGIPAVVGVHQATSRFSNGQRLRLDGTSGKITLLP